MTADMIIHAEPGTDELAGRAIKALRVYELGQELRPDREPPLSVQEYEAIRLERAGLMVELGWRPNEKRR